MIASSPDARLLRRIVGSLRAAGPGERRSGAFAALNYRGYRWFVSGQTVSIIGTWMQQAAQDWLVISITGSPAALGLTIACQFLPYLLMGLIGGSIAERFSKRSVLMVSQITLCGLASTLAVLVLAGYIGVWQINVLAFLTGLVSAVDDPVRETLVGDLVAPRHLPSAVSLNSAVFQIGRIGGPQLAGVLLTLVGAEWVFLTNAVTYLVVFYTLSQIRPGRVAPTTVDRSGRRDFGTALRVVAAQPKLRYPILLMAFISVFAFNYPLILASMTAGYYRLGPQVYGTLNLVFALGCLIGSPLAGLLYRRGGMRIAVTLAFSIGVAQLVAAAVAPSVVYFALALAAAGVVGQAFVITTSTWIQLNTEPSMRVRVMSVYMLVFLGANPLGNPLLGVVIQSFGGRFALCVSGGVAIGT